MSRYHPCLMASHSDPTLVRAPFRHGWPGDVKAGVAGTPPLKAGPRTRRRPWPPPPAGLYSAGVPPVAHAGVPLAAACSPAPPSAVAPPGLGIAQGATVRAVGR